MSEPREIIVKTVKTEVERAAWRKLSEDPIFGTMYQCAWWAEPLECYGVRTHLIGVWHKDLLMGGGLFRSIPIPYVKMSLLQCFEGPIFREWDPSWAGPFIGGVEDVARTQKSMEVVIEGCPQREVQVDLLQAFHAHDLSVKSFPGVTRAVLPLEKRTMDDIWHGMNKGTKWTIKKGIKGALEVRNLTDINDLRKAHEAWMATARRKGFSDVRPWKGLEPVLRYSVNNRLGSVLGSFLSGELLAAIFVTYVGKTAIYAYGGYMDHCEKYYPNHILQYKVIQQCLAMGVIEYSFGDLNPQYQVSRSGVDQFKLGFGAIPLPQTETISWIRKPLLCSARDWVKRQKSGKKIVAFLKDRVIRKAGS
jgi:hypothetical protein